MQLKPQGESLRSISQLAFRFGKNQQVQRRGEHFHTMKAFEMPGKAQKAANKSFEVLHTAQKTTL